MSFTSISFILFLAVVTLLYYLVPKRFQWCLLLLASYAFYLSSGVKQVFFLIATTVVNYVAGRIMQSMRDKFRAQTGLDKEQRREQKKAVNKRIHRVQVIAIIIDLAILILLKFLNPIIGNLNVAFTLFKYDRQLPLINIIVPIGISFYTFMSMGYLIDVGRGKYDAERNIGKFALFLSFFPSIIQGPINRYNDVGQQLSQPHEFSYENLTFGAQLIIWGFFKKLVIADRAAMLVRTIFNGNPHAYPGTVLFIGMLAYSAQIYGDFSGGIDIARGAAQILGINMPINFERPYFSTSVSDYWRRWHITLGAWMRDYVFYPIMLSKTVTGLGKSARKHFGSYGAKVVPSIITSFVVFFLVGIWHGVAWHYVAFGLFNATVVAGGVALAPAFAKMTEALKIRTDTFSWKLFQITRTFLLMGIGKILAVNSSLIVGLKIIKRVLTNITPWVITDGTLFTLGLDPLEMFILFMALLTLLTVSILQERGVKMRETIAKQNLAFRWIVYLVALFVVIIFGIYGSGYNAADFIYANF